MVNVIFCAHGQLACAMLDSVRMVYGDVHVSAVAFVPGENAGDIAGKLEELVSTHKEGSGSSPSIYSAAARGTPPPAWRCATRSFGSSAACRYRWLWSWSITSKR